jgi:hypothetical protein
MTVETMQPLRPLQLYWKTDGQDVRLGVGYHCDLPRKGELLSFSCERGMVWRVVEVYYGLIMEGSVTWRAWRDGKPHQRGMVDVFVTPAEGPFEP